MALPDHLAAARALRDDRVAVAVLPPGVPLEHLNEFMALLPKIVPHHELHMQNQDDGSIAIFYWDGDFEKQNLAKKNIIREEVDPNFEVEVGFEKENGEQGELHYASTEHDRGLVDIAAMLMPILEGFDAANYVTSTIITPEGKKYGMTLQRGGGMTPAQKIAALEARIKELEAT